jgi:hypothetical protein
VGVASTGFGVGVASTGGGAASSTTGVAFGPQAIREKINPNITGKSHSLFFLISQFLLSAID